MVGIWNRVCGQRASKRTSPQDQNQTKPVSTARCVARASQRARPPHMGPTRADVRSRAADHVTGFLDSGSQQEKERSSF